MEVDIGQSRKESAAETTFPVYLNNPEGRSGRSNFQAIAGDCNEFSGQSAGGNAPSFGVRGDASLRKPVRFLKMTAAEPIPSCLSPAIPV